MKRWIGVDPGLGGAVAVLGEGEASGLLLTWDTPVTEVTKNGKKRREYEVPRMRSLLLEAADVGRDHVLVLIEQSSPMPKEGVVSSWRSGFGTGLWHGLFVSLDLPFRVVHPAVWKKALGLTGRDKEAMRLEAQRRWPTADLARKKDHGRAESLFLAAYARQLDVMT